MIVIESRHIMDEIRKTCPVQITGSLDRITILPPKSYDKLLGVIRFETSEGVIRYPISGEIISVEL